jgi:multidrug efflux pump subunit AcrA (membrane-fusion protein)
VFILDSLLVGGLRFVLEKVADIADREINDPERWRVELLELQLRLETGQIDEAAFVAREAEVLARLRELQPARGVVTGAAEVASIDIETAPGDESEPER